MSGAEAIVVDVIDEIGGKEIVLRWWLWLNRIQNINQSIVIPTVVVRGLVEVSLSLRILSVINHCSGLSSPRSDSKASAGSL